MKTIDFTDEYKTGINSIDYEHEKIFGYINEIINSLDEGDSQKLLIEINIDELIGYTVFHFKHEEELMKEFNFEDYESHSVGHNNLKVKLADYKKRFGNDENVTEELIEFLRDWLFGHIKGVDTKYIELFKENNVD